MTQINKLILKFKQKIKFFVMKFYNETFAYFMLNSHEHLHVCRFANIFYPLGVLNVLRLGVKHRKLAGNIRCFIENFERLDNYPNFRINK
jgi:hypothetical protein